MISQYVNLYFPISSLALNIILCIVFFAKKKVKNSDTYLFSILLVFGFIESFVMFFTNLFVCFYFNDNTAFVFEFLNKLLYCIYLLWLTALLFYVYRINNKNSSKKIRLLTNVFNAIMCMLIFASPIDLYYENGLTNSTGVASYVLYFGCGVYLTTMLVMAIKNYKKVKNKNKYIPLIFLILLMNTMMIIRLIDPLFNISSNIFAIVLLMMYFTIENPDTKLVEEIAKSKEYAENYNAEKTYFIYNMTQEIKQPLTKVDRQLNSLINKVDDEDIKEELRNIEENVVNLNSIINGVLDISSIDSNKLNTINNKYSIELILKEIITNTKNKLNNSDVELRTEIDKNIPEKLFGDPIRLKQVINTILSNSIKYTKKGYIELNVSSLIKNDVCRLMIKIEDSGSGIKVDKLDTLFKRNKTENENNLFNENDSSELNLVNVRKILNIMGGTILINSDINSGTKITIVLDQKIVEDNKEEVNTIINDYNNDFKNHKILVIDENENNIKLITKLLEKFSIVSDSATNVKECFDKIEKNKYSLILLDDNLEKYSNFEILNKIKDITNTKIIALSKHTKLQYKDDYIKEGFSDYLQKPVSKKEIKEILEKYLK